MLSKQEVQHIAYLARISLNDQELEKYRQELSAILDYITKLQEVNIEGVEPMSHSVDLENIMRKDEAFPENPDRINKMIEQAPQKERGYVKVKAVL